MLKPGMQRTQTAACVGNGDIKRKLTRDVAMLGVILKRFEKPDEVRTFERGRFEVVRIGNMTIGRAIYEPGWRWSVDVGPVVGAQFCNIAHIGLVLAGCATA